jgi:hypothetical protein
MLKSVVNVSFKTFLFLIGFAIALALCIGIGMFSVKHPTGVPSITTFIQSHAIYFMAWRFSLMALAIYFYPSIVKKFLFKRVKENDISVEKMAKYMQRRWIILGFVFYEAFIVYNVLSYPINWVLGAGQ